MLKRTSKPLKIKLNQVVLHFVKDNIK